MKTVLRLMIILGAGQTLAADLVVFKAAEAGLESSYEEAPAAVKTEKEARWDFDTTKPVFAGYPKLFGGLLVRDSADTLNQNTTLLRLHDNDPASWPGKPVLFWQGSDSSAGTNYWSMTAVFVFKTAGKVTLPAGSSLRLNIQSWYAAPLVEGAWPTQARFVINNAGQYYISAAAYAEPKAGEFKLPDVAATQWAPVTLTPTEFSLPAELQFGPVTFDDVREVGWICRGSGVYLRQFSVDEFTVTTP